ncbi:S-adenosyl-L-methionine-dependent methyltransferase [Polychytrium aggregatum]|uniref:S-adenosyl-L-methionine-dependent methyltransferase n=1 Tax=Polychytrium aggregatum TaxID=110093 RepID=UPI0022FDF41A|nr:S-adenosyl-L-methionine-dependent methyltransferase [Polychytrium aggregatum]KAI9207012.1 S-adenosyl-L-methionine-dependent methyltransferase [Polychytrium aggregatum]
MARHFDDETSSQFSMGESERRMLCESEFDAADERWDDWEEDEEAASCPFCNFKAQPSFVFQHSKEFHSFDFVAIRRALSLDFYGGIRLINYVRSQTLAGTPVSQVEIVQQGRKAEWLKGDEYLKPVIDDDGLLYAFEDEEEDDDLTKIIKKSSSNVPGAAEGQSVTSVEQDLRARLAAAEQRAALAEARLSELTTAFGQYKELVKKTFLDERHIKPSQLTSAPIKPKEDDEDAEWQMDYYFGSYAETEIHQQMLKDRVRTESYRDFMYHNKNIFKDKVVLDVGCGTGILSMFAARSGAKQVISVDNSTIIKKARKIVAENELDHIITFVQGKVEDVKLPVESVDIIISEWMGYFLLFEGMLDSVLSARDKWLAPDGFLAPSRTDILIAAMDDSDYINDNFHFWNDVYGFKMTLMKKGYADDAQVDFASADALISEPVTVKRIDIGDATVSSLDFTADIQLVMTRPGRLNMLCGWFDTWFEAEDGETGEKAESVFFSTGPRTTGTHWKQTMFILENPIDVESGTVVEGQFVTKKSIENHRELVVTIDLVVKSSTGQPVLKDGQPLRIQQKFQVR